MKQRGEYLTCLSIAPHWNWNEILLPRRPNLSRPSIVRHWNWNVPKVSDFTQYYSPQSHYTGIEIQWQAGLPTSETILIRTTLELKYDMSNINISEQVPPQSHYTGIEIQECWMTLRCLLALNCTTLELNWFIRVEGLCACASIVPHWNWSLREEPIANKELPSFVRHWNWNLK